MAGEAAKAAKKKSLPTLKDVRLRCLKEGRAVQLMHVGPYSAVAPAIERLHAFIREAGRELFGLHHEIYMNDPRRVAPERLKTILREPVAA